MKKTLLILTTLLHLSASEPLEVATIVRSPTPIEFMRDLRIADSASLLKDLNLYKTTVIQHWEQHFRPTVVISADLTLNQHHLTRCDSYLGKTLQQLLEIRFRDHQERIAEPFPLTWTQYMDPFYVRDVHILLFEYHVIRHLRDDTTMNTLNASFERRCNQRWLYARQHWFIIARDYQVKADQVYLQSLLQK